MDIKEAAFLVIENLLAESRALTKAELETKEGKTGEAKAVDIHQAAVALGTRGGKEGGPARQEQLNDREKTELAKKGAKARWSRHGAHGRKHSKNKEYLAKKKAKKDKDKKKKEDNK